MVGLAENDAAAQRAEHTLARVHAGLQNRQSPMVAQIVRIIKDLSGKADRLSVNELVDVVSGDPTAMGQIFAIAGSLGYNSNGFEVTSIHHAVSLIGFERVRNLAISMLLLEHAQLESTARTNRDLAGLALVSGLIASEMAQKHVAVDPDLAFVCGALRNYGCMLAATFMPTEYAALANKPAEEFEEEFRSAFGMTPLELGHQLLDGLRLPDAILNSFLPLTDTRRKNALANAGTALTATAEFSLRLAQIVGARDLTAENFDLRVEALSREYAGNFFLSGETAREMLGTVAVVLDSFRSRSGSGLGSPSLFRRLECLAEERDLPPPEELQSRPKSAAPSAPAQQTDGELEMVVGVDEITYVRRKPVEDTGSYDI